MPEKHHDKNIERLVGQESANLRLDIFLWSSLVCLSTSIALKCMNRRHSALFVGQWVTPLLLLGIYRKIAESRDRVGVVTENSTTARTAKTDLQSPAVKKNPSRKISKSTKNHSTPENKNNLDRRKNEQDFKGNDVTRHKKVEKRPQPKRK